MEIVVQVSTPFGTSPDPHGIDAIARHIEHDVTCQWPGMQVDVTVKQEVAACQ